MTPAERLEALIKSRSGYANGRGLLSALKTDSSLMGEVRYLTKVFLHRTLDGCSSCAMDAYLELIHLNPQDMKTTEKKYELRAGALLFDAKTQTHYSNFNLTDEVAERLLAENPLWLSRFRKVPEKQEATGSEGNPGQKLDQDFKSLAAKAIADGLNKTKTVALLKEAGMSAKEATATYAEALVASVEATKAPADEAPADEAPADEAPADEAPVEEL
jgi:hypothetical protein